MKMGVPTTFNPNRLQRLLLSPFHLILFLFFFTLSGDLMHVTLGPYNFKMNNLMGLIIFVIFLAMFKKLDFSNGFFKVTAYLAVTMICSMLFGYNRLVCIGYICSFIFSYFVYFVLPSSLFRYFDSDEVFSIYKWSFCLVGIYASLQVVCSVFGLILPFVGQSLLGIARGVGFSYEPSYYALYLTPFAIFQTTQFLLRKKNQRKLQDIFFPNLFLLISTSSGCLFTYLAYFACLFIFRKNPMMERIQIQLLLLKFLAVAVAVIGMIWCLLPELVTQLFLKFFFMGLNHGSFTDRWNGIVDYWKIFLEHPILGTGLGGTASYILMNSGYDGIDLYDRSNLTTALGTNVTTEIFAALGLLGAIGFLWLLLEVIKTLRKTLRVVSLAEEERIRITSLSISLAVTFFTLQFSQTIFRGYIWVHVAICIGYAQFLLSKYAVKPLKSVS